MIAGLGVDIVEMEKMKSAIDRWGDRFLSRFLTDAEKGYCLSRPDPTPHVAARFAAKEAARKAASSFLPFQKVEVRKGGQGEPLLYIEGLEATVRTHLSLSHHGSYAIATVILEED